MNNQIGTVSIIGRPNIGKSRLFNRIFQKKYAIVSDQEGTTRDTIYAKIDKCKIPFFLIDTGGLVFMNDSLSQIEENTQEQAKVAIDNADIILVVFDSKTGPLKPDYDLMDFLRKTKSLKNKKIIFILSKCDELLSTEKLSDFYSLGIQKFIQVSAVHNKGISTLMSEIQKNLSNLKFKENLPNEENNNYTKISFIGRPNVGKSSLINAYLSEKRMIVSDTPGTTRDAVDAEITFNNDKFIIIDTAGIRKKGKIEPGLEKWSIARTLQSIERSDIVCLLLNAEESFVKQDQHIVEYALKAKKGLILLINKWDTQKELQNNKDIFFTKLKRKFTFLSWVPFVFISAKTKENIKEIFPLVKMIQEERNKRITTCKLNAFIRKIISKNPPKGAKRVKPKIFYLTQVDTAPPKFKVFVNKKEYFHFSYWRYLENQLRETFGFNGTFIEIDIVNRKSIYQT